MKVDVMAVPVVKTIDRRSARRNVDMNPTIAAKSIAGPKFLAGGNAYIMTARKIKASATDFWLWGTPSAFVTGTVKRLDPMVRISSTTNGPRPVHPDKGKLSVASAPRANKAPPRNVTTPRRLRLFQFLFGMIGGFPFSGNSSEEGGTSNAFVVGLCSKFSWLGVESGHRPPRREGLNLQRKCQRCLAPAKNTRLRR